MFDSTGSLVSAVATATDISMGTSSASSTIEILGELLNPFKTLFMGAVDYLPRILLALVGFVLGWIIAVFLAKLVGELIQKLKLETIFHETEVDRVIRRAGYTLNIGKIFSFLVEWFIIIGTFIVVCDILQLKGVTDFLNQILFYIPKVAVVAVTLYVVAVLGEFLQKLVRGGMHATGVKTANLTGSIVKWVIWIVGIYTALSSFGFDVTLIRDLFTAALFGTALAFALAFGLGGKEHASDLIAKIKDEISHRQP